MTLLLCVCSGAWADDFTPSEIVASGGTTKNHVKLSSTFSSTTSANVCNTSTTVVSIGSSANGNYDSNYIEIQASEGYTIDDLVIYGSTNKTDNNTYSIAIVYWTGTASSTFSSNTTVIIPNKNETGDACAAVSVNVPSGIRTARLYRVMKYTNNQFDGNGTALGSGQTTYIKQITATAASSDPVDPTITFSNGSYNVGNEALDLSSLFESNSTGAVTYSVTNAGTTGAAIGVDGKSFTATAAGTATVQASQASATGYNAKTVTATITVTNLTNPTFTVTSATDYVIGNSLTLSSLITANTSDGAVSYTIKDAGTTSASITEGVFSATAAGTAVVTIAVAATATYSAASEDVTITVMTNPLGSHTVTYALTANSANVTGSATSARLGSFSTAFTASNLTISGNQSGYSGGIKGTNSETSYDDTKYVDLTFIVADGYTFAPTAVSFKANPFNATGAMKYKLALIDDNNTILSEDITCSKSTDNAVTFASGAFTGKLLSGTVHIRAYFYGAASDKTIYIMSPITVTGIVAVARVVESTTIALTDVMVNESSITSAQLTTLKTPDAYTLTMTDSYAGEPTVTFEKTTTTTYTEGAPDVVVDNVAANMTADDEYYIATATVDAIEYTVKLPIDKTPRLESDVTEIEVSSAGPATGTAKIKLTGAYLTGDASVAFASSVDGLTVSPATITVTSGAVDQEFTVTYLSDDAVAEDNVNLTFTVGAKSVVIPVTYSSTAAITTITDVTGLKTWDFKTAGSANIESPAPLRLIPLANATGFAESFDAASLAGKGQYFYYNSYPCFQGSQLKFHTTVPGFVTVTFSNTGGNRPYRYLYVNGTATTFRSGTATEVETDPIKVEAGDVVLSGYIPNASDPQARVGDVVGESMLRFYSVVFTPIVSGTITASGWNTFSSNYALDLNTLTATNDVEAYYASATAGNSVTMTKTTAAVPAGEGIMIKGTAGEEFTISVAASGTSIDGNLLVGLPNGGEVAKANNTDTWNYVFGWTDPTDPGFYLVNNTLPTLGAGKAYLQTNAALTTNPGARLNIVFDSEATGINTLDNWTNSQIDANAPMYNLAGQKVNKSYKGIVIVNGKKVVRK